ncbi:MAG: chromosome partitioning protein ParB [Ferrovum sp. 37-45-19]|uniref:ParB/RepB/Spo0J family partition protein n=1 Tax=Ferrovum sp. JA12 TaxID=1356299 RepID=UPI000703AB6F|nr:ParB/RepB/Spo0J family partition protein [Ferrovum sp. JA12]OYV79384.1 MAG: chromosome partitioning protein ParB [Ferrovum sp. 21-44-67]OYV93977.1 MAG: chromosome partitioning protein ParB [Ferrovum sp. 37-45-19]HQT81811.1 ParB/RepB/Spo0J family partition protein [Ferrovaceae bacterium]KRH79388.1 putative chromosome-partitioning protein ParB [Ferrovum sp. JA12]HQU06764.1 ParB/RepB/Spo0J family partition protein [Ferrovaceae bacterium]
MVKGKGLGRGLDALLGGDIGVSDGQEKLSTLPISVLTPGRYQPRTAMSEEALNALARSIQEQGILQPILVRPLEKLGQYEIIAGERRWRAAQRAGVRDVPVIIKNIADKATLAVALIENIQREDLNPIEEAKGLGRLIKEFKLTHEEVAQAIGRSRSAVSNLLRLMDLDDFVQALINEGHLEMGHARALLSLPALKQRYFAQQAVELQWTVREMENRVRRELSGASPKNNNYNDPDVTRLQNQLSDTLGAVVSFKSGAKKGAGSLMIRYESLEQLEGILTFFNISAQ